MYTSGRRIVKIPSATYLLVNFLGSMWATGKGGGVMGVGGDEDPDPGTPRLFPIRPVLISWFPNLFVLIGAWRPVCYCWMPSHPLLRVSGGP